MSDGKPAGEASSVIASKMLAIGGPGDEPDADRLHLAATLAAAAGAGLGFDHAKFYRVRPKTRAKTRRVGYIVHGSDRKGLESPRNALCACGSGLKTKKCHGRRA